MKGSLDPIWFALRIVIAIENIYALFYHIKFILKCKYVLELNVKKGTVSRYLQKQFLFLSLFLNYFNLAAIALMKSSLFTAFTSSNVVIRAKSFVIVPDSIVSNVAFSN